MTRVDHSKTSNCKNVIVLYTGIGAEKQRVELYDFQSLDHILNNGVSYIRICCDGRFYYYKTMETAIAEINIYNR